MQPSIWPKVSGRRLGYHVWPGNTSMFFERVFFGVPSRDPLQVDLTTRGSSLVTLRTTLLYIICFVLKWTGELQLECIYITYITILFLSSYTSDLFEWLMFWAQHVHSPGKKTNVRQIPTTILHVTFRINWKQSEVFTSGSHTQWMDLFMVHLGWNLPPVFLFGLFCLGKRRQISSRHPTKNLEVATFACTGSKKDSVAVLEEGTHI